jgi:hypothetical protein
MLLERLALLKGCQLLLEMGKEILARGHQVRHVACLGMSIFDQSSAMGASYLVSPRLRCFS